MTAVWQTRLATSASRMLQAGAALADYAARPRVFSRIKAVLIVLLGVWVLASLWRAAWSFLPETAPLPATEVVNPVPAEAETAAAPAVDIEALAAVNLFGTPGSEISDEALAASGRSPAMSEDEAAQALAGIEDGAPETRLPLTLAGIVSASEAGLGQAVIEHRNLQNLYRVGDELPVSGEVVLAKVLPTRVVLDNGGRYEILRLFEESELMRQAENLRREAARRPVAATASDARNSDEEPQRINPASPAEAAELAARYRDQLYDNPESLADVVRVSAVRDGAELRGYRLAPGRSAEGFAALGFQAGDIVTAINGLSLADPSNTMRLYQVMRSAQSATFELERGDETLTLNVSLGGGGEG